MEESLLNESALTLDREQHKAVVAKIVEIGREVLSETPQTAEVVQISFGKRPPATDISLA